MRCPDRFQRRDHPVIYGGVVELVDAVVAEEVLQRLGHESVILRVAQRPPHQHSSAIADIGRDHLFRERGPAVIEEHGVDRLGEVFARIDEGSVKIEDDQADTGGGKWHSRGSRKSYSRVYSKADDDPQSCSGMSLGVAYWVDVRGLDRGLQPSFRWRTGYLGAAEGWYGVRRWRLQPSLLQKSRPVGPLPERVGQS